MRAIPSIPIFVAGFLCVPGLAAQAVEPLGEHVPVYHVRGDVSVVATGPESDQVRVEADPTGGFFERRGVDLLLRVKDDQPTHFVATAMGEKTLEVDGMDGERVLPIDEDWTFDEDGAPRADSVVFSGTEGSSVGADLRVLVPEGHTVTIGWAAGTLEVEGWKEERRAQGNPAFVRIENDDGVLTEASR